MSFVAESTILAPFEIWEVPLDDERTIKFHEPLILTPTRMPDDPDEPGDVEYFDLICPKLGIDVFADNIDDLIDYVRSDIRFVWKHIVLKDDCDLDAKSRSIRQNHLAIAEVLDG